MKKPIKIAVVGPCSSGKSTLTTMLKERGYVAKHPAQEHSYVQEMWQKITKPDILIYLDVSYETARRRRPHIDGGRQRLADQHHKLAHARKHCDFYIDTSELTVEEIQKQVLDFLVELTGKETP